MGERIVFDLDGTLIEDQGELRPGALDLVEGLDRKRHHLILWTGGGKDSVRQAKNRHPKLFKPFKEIYHQNHLPKFDAKQYSPTQAYKIGELLKRCGKYPPLVRSYLIIDDSDLVAWAATDIGGFTCINSQSSRDDQSPDEWAERVEQSLRALNIEV